MTLSINTNISALNAQRNLQESSNRSESSIQKLSSGTRINTAADDAAALAISSGLKLDLASLRAAGNNVSQATSILQIADGGYEQIGEILNRMQTLSSSSQSDQISATERGFLDTEFQNLLSEIDRIADSTEFNGIELLGGSASLDSANTGSGLTSANGFVGFEFDSSIRTAGDSIQVAFDDGSDVFDVQVFDATGGGGNLIASQSINLNDLAGDPFDISGTGSLPAGNTETLNFDSIGVELTLNSDFDTTATTPVANGAAFGVNGVDVASGGASTAPSNLDFLVGINTSDVISSSLQQGNAAALGVGGTSVANVTAAQGAATAINGAVNTLNDARADVGATLNRLEFAGSNVSTQIENSEAARSVLEDTDISEEFTRFTSAQVLVQAGVSILSQANQQPSLLLQLLQ